MDKFHFLTDIERELIEAFVKNETQREAVKKVLLFGIYSNGVIKAGLKHDPTMNWALALSADMDRASNEQLGANLRAVTEGLRVVEHAFVELSKFDKGEPKKESKGNPAR